MESNYLEINYVGFTRAWLTGHIANEVVEFELNAEQMEALYDFNESQCEKEIIFLRKLYDDTRS